MSPIPEPPFPQSHSWTNPSDEPSHIPQYPHLPLDASIASDVLSTELDISRLNAIYKHLWIAGRRRHFKPLHRQLMLRREIVITEDPSMHLVWFENTIFFKPIPHALLDWNFWKGFICVEGEEGAVELRRRGAYYGSACGFLLSYTEIISHPSDYHIAVTKRLIPDISWSAWCLLVSDIKSASQAPGFPIERRWEYGELRLSRLNLIYKLTMRGYSYSYMFTEYQPYFSKNFQLLLLAFAYCSVLLTAMQVVVTVQDPQTSWLVGACAGFAVLTIGSVLVVVCGILGLFAGLFFYHLFLTLRHQRSHKPKTHVA